VSVRALSEGHADIVEMMRAQLEEARAGLEGQLDLERVRRAHAVLGREIERMAGLGLDWEQELDGMADMLDEGTDDRRPRPERRRPSD
jgi:hypothetical protein